MFKIFIIEKDPEWMKFFSDTLGRSYELGNWADGSDIFEELHSNHYDVVILDLSVKKEDPLSLLRKIKSTNPFTPVIVTSQIEEAEFIVKAIKLGAFDFVSKPIRPVRIRHVVQMALDNRDLKNEIDYLRHEQAFIYDFDHIIADSPAMKKIMTTLRKFSKTDSTILLKGATGTGKSFLSGTIHFNSHRRHKPFVKINCANLPEALLESELFGHEKGAFTGAVKLRIGRFEQAHGGTLFLDEVGEMSLPLQAKLLRVLEDRSFERIGGNQTIHADVRILAATNRNLEDLVARGGFREDLYYRINVLFVALPPLQERKQCIEPLAYSLLDKTGRSLRKKIEGFAQPVMEMIKTYAWPGNIRELANAIERGAILEESTILQEENFSIPSPVTTTQTALASNLFNIPERHEKELIMNALRECSWVQKDAGDFLGISPRVLNYKIKKYGITHSRWRRNT
jgi:DNA-binding NtrC family response regulator